MLKSIRLLLLLAPMTLSYLFSGPGSNGISALNRCARPPTAIMLKRDDDSVKRPTKPFKTGSHTYASWKSPRDESDDDDYLDSNEETFDDEYGSDEDIDDDYAAEDDTERSESPFLSAMRKLYDAVFFYGLEPLPAASRKLKKKLNMDLRGSSSPFFTPSEQRVQRYLSQSFREVEQPELAQKRRKVLSQSSAADSAGQRRRGDDDDNASNNVSSVRKAWSVDQNGTSGSKSKSKPAPLLQDMIRRLEENLTILNEELEVVDAEIVTASALRQRIGGAGTSGSNIGSNDNSRKELAALKQRREDLLDEIEGIEIEIVDAKLKLKSS